MLGSTRSRSRKGRSGNVPRQRLLGAKGKKTPRASLSYQFCLYLVYLSVFFGLCFSAFLLFSLATGSYDKFELKSRSSQQVDASLLDPKWGKSNVNPSLREFIARRSDLVDDSNSRGFAVEEIAQIVKSAKRHVGQREKQPALVGLGSNPSAYKQEENAKKQVAVGSSDDNRISVRFHIYNNENCDASQSGAVVSEVTLSSEGSLQHSLCEDKQFADKNKAKPKSIIIDDTINGELDLYEDCGATAARYHSSVFKLDGCFPLYDWPPVLGIVAVADSLSVKQPQPSALSLIHDKLPPLQPHISAMIKSGEWNTLHSAEVGANNPLPSYHVVYSGESSLYMAYQAQAAYYGFLTSDQAKGRSTNGDDDLDSAFENARFSRLLTGQNTDDLAAYIPTFQAKRCQYSKRYGPTNKADVLLKWMNSADAPTQDIVVIMDPDNWIIGDISHWVRRAKKGHALAEAAWFHGSKLVTQLWKEVCEQNCDFDLDLVGVPYIIHRDDLKQVVPWFRYYILKMKAMEEKDKTFQKRYSSIQMGWGTEMFGYIFGAAHSGVKHEVVRGIQVRDVSARPKSKAAEKQLDMIHMGRAWFPQDYEPGRQWWHTEGRAFSHFGAQVWCKCNWTASDIIPWPLPEATDFQSRHTLYLLHESREYFGPIDATSPYRRTGEGGYHWAMP